MRARRTTILVLGMLALLAAPAFSEWRFDLGVDIPRGLGGLSDEGLDIASDEIGDYILPFPEVGIYYQWEFGPARIGAGVRAFTLILETVFWPNIIAEIGLGPVVVEGQLGGLLFAAFGLASDAGFGQVLVPDLSAWLKLGKLFRVGVGGTGLWLPEMDGMVFAYYIGAKVVIVR